MITTTNEALIKTLADLKWKDGFACRKCGHNLYKAGTKTEGGRKCKKCDTEESLKRYTVFDNSKIPLEKAYDLIKYMVKICRLNENEKWFKAASLAEDEEKDQFEQRLTLSEFVKRMNDRIEVIKVRIDNLDTAMEKWFKEVDKNMQTYQKEYKSKTEFNNAKLFKPLRIMATKKAELDEEITYPQFLEKAIEVRHRLKLILEGQENSLERRALKYFRTKKPTIASLAKKFELEENTVRGLMKKLYERLNCFYRFDSSLEMNGNEDQYNDVVKIFQDSKYSFNDFLGLFMFPFTEPFVNGETRIDRKWYRIDEWNGDWFLRQIHFVKKDSNEKTITYYNKPEEEEYICTNPEDYDGSLFIISIN